MLQIDISGDIEKAIGEVGGFFWTQVPYATSVALNNSIFDVRKKIVESTYPQAFTVRNKAFPGRLWRVIPRATKKRLETILTQTLDRSFMVRHTTGGTKRGKTGGRVAVPVKPEKLRSSNGRIRAQNKPSRIASKKGVFVIAKGQKKFILRRGNKGQPNELLYVIVPQANIKREFRFYEDATATALSVFSGHWNVAMDRAIATSRFTKNG